MLRTSVITLLLCLSVFTGHSQVNYIDYHKKIIGAEELFLKGKIDSSLIRYRQIFTEYQKGFAKDYFIALQLACMIYDTANANYFFKKSFEHGLSWVAISYAGQVNRAFNRFPGYKERTKELYNVCRTSYYKTVDLKTRSDLSAMLYKDDLMGHSIPFDKKDRDIGLALAAPVLDENIQQLTRICQKDGFPGEHKVGFVDHDMDLRKSSIDPALVPVASRIFFHHGCGYHLLKKELMDAVIKGELHPREFALIYEWSYDGLKLHPNDPHKNDVFRFYKVKCATDKQEKHYNLFIDRKLDWPDETFVNKCRSDIGISTLAHDELKKQYAKKYGLLLFFGIFEEM